MHPAGIAGTARAARGPFPCAPAGGAAPQRAVSTAVSQSLERSAHAALEALAEGFCMADADHRVTYWNAAAERLFGVPRRDALGREVWDLLPADGASELRERLARADGAGAVLHLTLLSDRELFARHLAVHASPLESGGLALHFRDATAEQRLAAQYEQLLESIRDGFIAVDRDWRITYVNRAAETLLSVRRSRAAGVDVWPLLPKEPRAVVNAIRWTMRERGPRHLEAIHPRGKLYRGRRFDVWTHPLPDGGVSILFEDVTDRLAKEVELARLAAEAEEASRAKSRFFAAVSHELCTPLNAIVGYTHLLATNTYGNVPAGAVRASERAGVCAEHLSRLVDDVLLLTTVEIDKLPVFAVAVSLAPFLESVLPHLRQQAEAKRLELRVDVPPGLPPIDTDPERLRQIVTALVSNAIKFTGRGVVSVRARMAGEGRWLEISVRDTGPGIDPDDRERIFGPFEQVGGEARTDSATRGTGLGLTIARQLARKLGGDITVGGTFGEGAEFVVRLPA